MEPDAPWSTAHLKEYFERVLSEKDKAINIALAASKEAVAVAEANAAKWRDNANEWRQAMTDREKLFLPRPEFDQYKASTAQAIAVEKERGDRGQGSSAGLKQGWGILLGAVTLIVMLISIGSVVYMANRPTTPQVIYAAPPK